MPKEYARYGKEWEAEMMKMNKKELVAFIKSILLKHLKA